VCLLLHTKLSINQKIYISNEKDNGGTKTSFDFCGFYSPDFGISRHIFLRRISSRAKPLRHGK